MVQLLRFYHRWRELITVSGYLVMLGSILSGLWIGFCFIQQANANTADIATLKEFKDNSTIRIQHIDDTLDDLMTWYHIPRKKSADKK